MKLDKVDGIFSSGLMRITWSSLGVSTFITKCRNAVNHLNETYEQIAELENDIKKLLQKLEHADIASFTKQQNILTVEVSQALFETKLINGSMLK